MANKKVEIVIHYSSCFQLEPHFSFHDEKLSKLFFCFSSRTKVLRFSAQPFSVSGRLFGRKQKKLVLLSLVPALFLMSAKRWRWQREETFPSTVIEALIRIALRLTLEARRLKVIKRIKENLCMTMKIYSREINLKCFYCNDRTIKMRRIEIEI